jgi:hypothetical protein
MNNIENAIIEVKDCIKDGYNYYDIEVGNNEGLIIENETLVYYNLECELNTSLIGSIQEVEGMSNKEIQEKINEAYFYMN